jgi:hypothetical protein
MTFVLDISDKAKKQIKSLKEDAGLAKRYKAVSRALRQLAVNPRYPGLEIHPIESLSGPNGEKIFEAYAENNTPAAYRIFWCYDPGKGVIHIISVQKHPD